MVHEETSRVAKEAKRTIVLTLKGADSNFTPATTTNPFINTYVYKGVYSESVRTTP